MSRPTTKADLLEESARQYDAVVAVIEAMSQEKRLAEFAFEDRDRNVRDVVGHLHEWHLMMLGWYAEGMAGGKPAIPAPGHTWRTLPALNAEIWRRCQEADLDATLARFRQTHGRLQVLVESLDDAELWEKRRFAWTGSTSLGAFLVSSTSSHYVWALKKLRRHARAE